MIYSKSSTQFISLIINKESLLKTRNYILNHFNTCLLLLFFFSAIVFLIPDSSNSQSCTEPMPVQTCTMEQISNPAECMGCSSTNPFCCPSSGGCNSDFNGICVANSNCTDQTICKIPDQCSEPMPVQSCTMEQIEDECSGCSQTNPFCCPSTGGCDNTFSGICLDNSMCTNQTICEVPPPPPAVLKRDISFVNYCQEDIWVGASTNQLKGGWEMPQIACTQDSDCTSTDTCNDAITAGAENCTNTCVEGNCVATIEIKIKESNGNISGRLWPMTGCNFNPSDICPSGRCCDTGSCTISNGKDFGLQCKSTGDAPTTVAEFTLQTGINNDFYDISLIDGFNVPVEMKPIGTAASVPNSFVASYWCGNPGGVTPAVFPSNCKWDTTFSTDCGGKPELRTVGSLETCSSDADCSMGSGTCNLSSGVCECTSDTDCSGTNICGVPDPGITGIKACGSLTGCTTPKDICGLYFGKGTEGESCGQDKTCASNICETIPSMSCSTSAECNNNSQCTTNFCENKSCYILRHGQRVPR